eukprot:3517070-Prymnesium_polylepis.1
MSWSQRKEAEAQAQYAAVVSRIPVEGVCARCKEQILKKKATGDYKALRPGTLGKCTGCSQKKVAFAYYTLCTPCARTKQVCAKCATAAPLPSASSAEAKEIRALTKQLEEEHLSERQRRTVLRKIERLKTQKREVAAAEREKAAGRANGGGAQQAAEAEGDEADEEEGDDDDDEPATTSGSAFAFQAPPGVSSTLTFSFAPPSASILPGLPPPPSPAKKDATKSAKREASVTVAPKGGEVAAAAKGGAEMEVAAAASGGGGGAAAAAAAASPVTRPVCLPFGSEAEVESVFGNAWDALLPVVTRSHAEAAEAAFDCVCGGVDDAAADRMTDAIAAEGEGGETTQALQMLRE